LLETWQPGAVVLFGSNTDQSPQGIAALTASYQATMAAAGGVPLFVATDQEGGIVVRLQQGFTTWPVPMLLTATNDPELAYTVGQAVAAELRAVGINMNLAPIADLNTNLNNPIIGRRSPGADPELVATALTFYVRGLQAGGVMATVKHFPGHGDTDQDSHTTLAVVPADRERLDAVELPPFVAAIREGYVGAVMVGHLWLPQLEPEPLPATLSATIVTGLLRDDLGFTGIAMTDALDMDSIDTVYSPGEAAIMALLAGIDLLAYGPNMGETSQMQAMQAVVDAVRDGTIDEARIDESVRRILAAKARFGLLTATTIPDGTGIDIDGHAALVEWLFREGVTVGFDRSGLIPVSPDTTIGVIYPANRGLAQRECSVYRPDARWMAVSDNPSADEVATAQSVAALVDTVVVFTRDAFVTTGQQALVRALPPERTVVVALISPYDYLRFPDIGAYMATYSPLDPALTTACAVLFGAQTAQGRLPFALDAYGAGD
jgi:beta-N-acetylhexosaminidase